MFDFAEALLDMTAEEILNYYRNRYYAEPLVTERGIVANAINDILPQYISQKAEIERLQKHNTEMARRHYTDGIKEFAERLKLYLFLEHGDLSVVSVEDIDSLVKEMTEA